MSTTSCICGAVNCTRHRRTEKPNRTPTSVHYGADWQETRRRLLAAWYANPAKECAICFGLARPDDPWEPDHIRPVAQGGTGHPSNIRCTHRSCNRRAGAQLKARLAKERADARAAEAIRRTTLYLVER